MFAFVYLTLKKVAWEQKRERKGTKSTIWLCICRVSIKEASVGKLGSVCRRVYRIFSHAYFHHRRIFDDFEAETYLCHRFTHFVTKYTLMSKENLIVPIEGVTDVGPVAGESEA